MQLLSWLRGPWRAAPLPHLLVLQGKPLVSFGEISKTDVLIPDAPGHNAVIKVHVRCAVMQLADLKPGWGLVSHVEPFALSSGREKDMVFTRGIYSLDVGGVEYDARCPIREMTRAKVLEPVFWRLHRVESYVAAPSVYGHNCGF